MKKFLKSNFVLLGILLLALFFRYWQIFSLPGGLFPDEAANGLDVNSILSGHLQPFYERGNGREALFFYFLALSVALFGRGPWQHHLVSAGFGFAAVLVTYFLTKRLFDKKVALLSSLLFATSSFAVTLCRTAFRANLIPLLTTLTLLFVVKFLQAKTSREKFWSALFGGAIFALGFYSYPSFWMMIPLLGLMLALILFAERKKLKKILGSLCSSALTFLGAFLVFFAPIGYYFFTHLGSFAGRAGQVSIFSSDLNQGGVLGTLVLVFKKTILSFFTAGDLNWRHNVSGYPFLSPLVSPFFAAGLLLFSFAVLFLLRQALKRRLLKTTLAMSLVGLWFWLMLLPEIMSAEGIPHGLRLAGVIPSIFILPAWVMVRFWERLKTLKPKTPLEQKTKIAYAALLLSAIFVYDFSLYFQVAASSPDYSYAFRSDLTEVSNYLNQRNNPAKTYLSLDKFSVQTVDYLTTKTKQPYNLVDPALSYRVELKKGDQMIFTMSTLFDRLKFKACHPEAELVLTKKNQFGQIIMLVYERL